MKHSYTLLLCLTGFSITQGAQAPDQIVNAKVNASQQAIDTIIAQANLDPFVAQALMGEVNILTQEITANLKQDTQDIRVAATLITALEAIQKTAKANNSYTSFLPILTNLKHATRANMVHTLILGAMPDKLSNTPYYTDPYTETIGFTLNDYVLNSIATVLVALLAPTPLGKAMKLNPISQQTVLATQILAGLAAHCAWLLEKKFIIIPMLQNQDNTQAS